MSRTAHHVWLNRFAVLTAAATLGLIGIGGLVTSHGAGMAVPDWPTTYGYNMFLFPISLWHGGIFYEHSHRLFASFVGLLTAILAVWLWLQEARPWLRWMGVAAFASVVAQGVLGGLRVTTFKDEIGIFHATFAQLFLVLVSLIAIFTSRSWKEKVAAGGGERAPTGLRPVLIIGTILILIQLVLGATMRHQHAGLAVPDFPLAYGRIWPPMDEASIEGINRSRVDARDYNPITAFQIGLHMVHRIGALLTLGAVGCFALKARRVFGKRARMARLAAMWFGLILLQAFLGAATVLSNKAADVATAHVIFGAGSLVLGAILCVVVATPQRQSLSNLTRTSFDAAPHSGSVPNPKAIASGV